MVVAELVANLLTPVLAVLRELLTIGDALGPILSEGAIAGLLTCLADSFAGNGPDAGSHAGSDGGFANPGIADAGFAAARPRTAREEIVESALARPGAGLGAGSCAGAAADVEEVVQLALAWASARAGSYATASLGADTAAAYLCAGAGSGAGGGRRGAAAAG
jgi:hypothetical protein